VKKTEVASNPKEYGDYWENIGGRSGRKNIKLEVWAMTNKKKSK